MFPLLDILTPIIGKVLDYIPDPQKKAEAQLKLQQELDNHQQAILDAFTKSDVAQDAINQAEANSGNKFAADWRPLVGWVCACAFAWAYVIQPIVVFALVEIHPDRVVHLPTIDFSSMSTVLMGMLGLAGMHTYKEINK
jgi:hypothetical protein